MSRAASRLVAVAALLLLVLGVFTAGVVAMREPFALNDYTAIWGLKARALYRTGSLAALFRVDPDGSFSHPEYPPLWPLLLTVATRGGLPYDDLVATPMWVFLVVGASLLAVRAARSLGAARPFSLLAGAAVSLLPYWRRYPGYAEGLLLVFVLAAAGEAVRAGRDRGATVRLSVFLTLAAWTKPEGLVAALVAALVLALARRARAALVVCLSALFLAALPWALIVSRLAPQRPRTDFALSAFSLGKALAAFLALASEASPAAGLVLAGAGLLALAPATLRRRRALLAWAALYSGALLGAFAFSRLDPAWHVRWSWDRLLVVPVAAVIPALAEALEECLAGGSGRADPVDASTGTPVAAAASRASPLQKAPQEVPMKRGWLAKGGLFVLLSAGPLLLAIPASAGSETPRSVADSGSRSPNFTATVVERKGDTVSLKRDDGDGVEILSEADPGVSLRIGKGVEKGSHVKVTEEDTGSSTRTFTIRLLPAA